MKTTKSLLLVAAAVAALAGPAPAAIAATFTPNSTADEPDLITGDGLCLTAAGDCTLRAAVQESNVISGGPHTILLVGGATYTLTRGPAGDDTGERGDLDILVNLTIAALGDRVVVRGRSGWDDGIFDIVSGVPYLNGLDIRDGHTTGSGGGIRVRLGQLASVNNCTITGNTAEIYGDGVFNGGTLTMTNCTVSGNSGRAGGIANLGKLTLTNSTVSDNRDFGGIYNSGFLTVSDSTVSGNSSRDSGGGILNDDGVATVTGSTISGNAATVGGGGIFSNYQLTVTNSTISGNVAGIGGGGISAEEQFTANQLTVTNSRISGNRSGVGGGIQSDGVSLAVTGTTIRDNSAAQGADQDGGGIWLSGAAGSVTASTVSGNRADRAGGGIYVTQPAGTSRATLTLTNTTISGNTALGDGGGIWTIGNVTSNSVTIAENSADSNGNGTGDGGGVFNVVGAAVSLANTIVATNVDQSPANKYPDCVGSVTSRGYNLIQNTSGCTILGDTTGNITGRAPQLGPLQDNGGSTFTHALLILQRPGFTIPSPAIDAGNPGSGMICPSTDQRGAPRLDGNADGVARCDIGAYEYIPPLFRLGTFALAPSEASVHPGERVTYTLEWTVPPPRGWRSLRTLELAFLDDEGTAQWVRFVEVAGAPGLFRLVHPKNGNAGPSFAPGRPNRLESEFATVYLADSAVDGPPGPKVTVTLVLSFKPHAAGRVYEVLVGASDDAGEVQGFHRAGTVAVTG